MTLSETANSIARDFDRWLQPPNVNLGDTERLVSVGAGLGLVAFGLRKNSGLGILGLAGGAALIYRGLSGYCAISQALGINTQGHNDFVAVPAQEGFKVEHSVVINRSAQDLYEQWNRLDRLPQIFPHLKQVTVRDARHSRWVAKGPVGSEVAWDAELYNDRPNELIAWRSLPGSTVDTAGSVRFQSQGPNATEVTVNLKYNPPAGQVGATIASWLGTNPAEMVAEDLQRFKQRMESAATGTAQAASNQQKKTSPQN